MSAFSNRDTRFLEEMGIGPLWVRRDAPEIPAMPEMSTAQENRVEPAASAASASSAAPAPSAVSIPGTQPESAVVRSDDAVPAPADVQRMNWTELRAAVAGCTKCGLCRNRNNTVFGVGDERAKWLFVGEGPGRNEDLQGEPFVGPAGKLLDNMLLAMGLKRGENTFIANIVKCRPTDPNGRDRPPASEEAAACMPYLERQIALIQPTVIVALGKTAALSLLGLDPATPVSKLRGTVHRYAGRPLIVTYHPAYLLRTLTDKKKAWADLCLAMSTYAKA